MVIENDAEFALLLKKELAKCVNAIDPNKDNTKLLIFIIKLSNSLLELSEGVK